MKGYNLVGYMIILAYALACMSFASASDWVKRFLSRPACRFSQVQ